MDFGKWENVIFDSLYDGVLVADKDCKVLYIVRQGSKQNPIT